MNDLSDMSSIKMWVAPKNKLNFECSNQSKINVDVFNISGTLMDTRSLNVFNGSANMLLNPINKGVYLICVKNDLDELLLKQKAVIY